MSSPGGPTAKEAAIGSRFGTGGLRDHIGTCADCGKEISRGAVRCKPCRGRLTRQNAAIEEDAEMLALKVAGRTLEEIGARFGISKQRVSVRIQRAVERLPEWEKRYLYGDR